MCDNCHMVKVKCRVKNLEALRRACNKLGWALKENQKTFKWYGKWVNDYHDEDAAYKQGINTEDYGKCEHAIQVPGAEKGYEIGILADGSITYDFYDKGLMEAVGGKEAPKLAQVYQTEATKLKAESLGYEWSEEILQDGTVKVEVEVQQW